MNMNCHTILNAIKKRYNIFFGHKIKKRYNIEHVYCVGDKQTLNGLSDGLESRNFYLLRKIVDWGETYL